MCVCVCVPEGLEPVSAEPPGHSKPPVVCNTPPRQHCSLEGSSAETQELQPDLLKGKDKKVNINANVINRKI